MPGLADDLRLAGELVTEAGRLAQRMRRDGVEGLEQKTAIADVVTAADRAAEAHIADRLAVERPDDGVLGEEGASRDGRRTWIIDPVDGTYNFVAGLTWWCSAIALVEGDELLLGAVYHPHDDVLYAGGPSLPTTRNGEPLAPLADRPLSHSCVTTYLSPAAMRGPIGEAFSRGTAGAAAIRMLGSGSMDMTAIAQGQLHAFCQRDVPPWDRLPGEALVRGVGGVATTAEAGGVTWTVIGVPAAVEEIRSGLSDR
jgi:myo-inositol-1(or 4)-monophosphatase